MIIVNGWKRLTIITKHSILDVAAALDPPLHSISTSDRHERQILLATTSYHRSIAILWIAGES